MIEIIPAVLPHSHADLLMRLGMLRGAPGIGKGALMVQLDLCDGLFVPTRTWPFNPADRASFAEIVTGDEGLPYWEDFNYEVDLMAHQPESLLPNWIAAGVSRAVVHLESRHDWEALRDAAGQTVELGLAIDLDPPFDRLNNYLPKIDYLQIMGISHLGRQGEELDPRVYELVKRIRADFPDGTIQIDGGVTIDNAPELVAAGIDRLVVGSKIVGDDDPRRALKEFQNIA